MTEEEQDELAQFHFDRLDNWEQEVNENHDPSCTAYFSDHDSLTCACGQRPALEQIWRQQELHNQWAGLSGASSTSWFPSSDRVKGQIVGLFMAIQILAEAFHDHPDYKPEWRLLRD